MQVIFIWAVFLYEIVTSAIYFSYHLIFPYKFIIFRIVIRRVRKIANKRLFSFVLSLRPCVSLSA